jgi:tryptophan-rich sensory protein
MLALVGFVGLCLLVGAAEAAMTTSAARGWYLSLSRPPGTVPIWAFGPAWVALSVVIGAAGWLVWHRSRTTRPVLLWGWQLAAGALWTPAFFGLHNPLLALAVSCVLLALIVTTIHAFGRLHRLASWLMLPYLAWSGYATYLAAGFWWLNQA